MLLIWWSAHKLTWDCTHIDEKAEGCRSRAALGRRAGRGRGDRRQESGVREPQSREPKRGVSPPKSRSKKKKKKPRHDSRCGTGSSGTRSTARRSATAPHTPGVWVIYFALAALPLFALGQSLIDPRDDKRRQATFLQMVGVRRQRPGLLVTTSLLGLRRYLRQRKAKIPGRLDRRLARARAACSSSCSWCWGRSCRGRTRRCRGSASPRAGKADREASKYRPASSGARQGRGGGRGPD